MLHNNKRVAIMGEFRILIPIFILLAAFKFYLDLVSIGTAGDHRLLRAENSKEFRGLLENSLLVSKKPGSFVRKFVVVQPERGLGNRISGIISTSFLAYMMDRVLVLDWQTTGEFP